MKKLLLLFFLFPLFHAAQNQSFGYHAKWTFYYDEAGFQGVDSIYHKKDSVYLGENWIVLGRGQFSTHEWLVQTANDSVFYVLDGQKSLMFIFNSQPGFSWQFSQFDNSYLCPDTPRAIVNSFGFDTINGVPLRFQSVSNIKDTMVINGNPTYRESGSYWINEKFYEKTGVFWGPMGFIFPILNVCNGMSFKTNSAYQYYLRCYQDDSISVNFKAYGCNSKLGVTDFETSTISLFPNPTDGGFSIKSPLDWTTLEVYNAQGQLVAIHPKAASVLLPTAHGLYVVRIQLVNGESVFKRIIRN